MANESYAYTNPTVVLREREDAGIIEFGFDIEGAFIPFGAAKLEGFREDLQEAREQAQAESQQQAAQPQPPESGTPPQPQQPQQPQ